MRRTRLLFLAAGLAAVLVQAVPVFCQTRAEGGYGTAANTANLEITFSPDPVPTSTSACFGVTPAWLFTATMKETAGVGITMSGFTTAFFDSNDNLISVQSSTADDFAALFGSTHIPANGTVVGNECGHLAGRTSGKIIQAFTGTDDNGNTQTFFCDRSLTLLGPTNQGANLQLKIVSSANLGHQSAALPGEPLLFTATIANAGPGVATNAIFTLPVPAGSVFDSIAETEGSCRTPAPGDTGTIACSIGSIGPGGSARIWVVVDVTGSAVKTGMVTATGTVSSDTADPDQTDNTATEQAPVLVLQSPTNADISISTSLPPGNIAAGTRATLNVNISNAGPGSSQGFGLVDLLPAGATFVVLDSAGLSCTTPAFGSAGAVVCGLDGLVPGASRTVALTVNVLSAPGSALVNTAKLIEGSSTDKSLSGCAGGLTAPHTADPNSGNDVGTAGQTVQGGGTVSLSWQQPQPTQDQPTPPPVGLHVTPRPTSRGARPHSFVLPTDTGNCTLADINIYKSDKADVMKVDPVTGISNLWMTVPPDHAQTTMAAAPGGSFYAIANVWNCGGTLVESGLSNEQNSSGTSSSPQISSVAPNGKSLVIQGTGFSSGAVVTSNGADQKTVNGTSTELTAKKLLKRLRNQIGTGKMVTLRVRNSDGSLSNEFGFTIP